MAKSKKRGRKLPKLGSEKSAAREGSDAVFWLIIVIVLAFLLWLLYRNI